MKTIGLAGAAGSGKDTAYEYISEWAEEQGLTAQRDAFADRLKISAAHSLGVFANEIEFCNRLKTDGQITFSFGNDDAWLQWFAGLRAKKGRDFGVWKEAVLATAPYTGTRQVRSEQEREVMQDRKEHLSALRQFESDVPVLPPSVLRDTMSGRTYLQLYGTEAHREVFGTDFWVNVLFDANRTNSDLLVITDVRFPNEADAIHERGGKVWQIQRESSGAGNHSSEIPLEREVVDCTFVNDGTLDDFRRLIRTHMEVRQYV